MNALFTPLDMTDYEDTFVGFNELGSGLPINSQHLLKPVVEEPWPMNHALVAFEDPEKRPMLARSKTHRDLLETKAAAAEEEDEEEEEEEEGEEEGGEEEGGEEEEEEEPEAPAWPQMEKIPHMQMEDKYFYRGENLRNKFNEVELDAFMRLLNVKPHKQWQDTSLHHYKLGAHTYEDDAQHLDPAFHLLAEVERKYQEKLAVEEFRKGSEIKFEVSNTKRPAHYNYRF